MSERWKPEEGERYYFIGADGKAGQTVFYEVFESGPQNWELGNCFKTEAEAQVAAEKVKALLLNLPDKDNNQASNLPDKDNNQASNLPDKDLPDWCKPGEWVYLSNEEYDKIESIDGFGVNFASGAIINKEYIHEEAVSARLRQYNDEEMMGLVGKVLRGCVKFDFFALIVYAESGEIQTNAHCYTADELLNNGYTIDGKLCGVLEHLEDGEWVE
jgi:hypothetical protein